MPVNMVKQKTFPNSSPCELPYAQLEKPLSPSEEEGSRAFGEILDLWLSHIALSLKPSTCSTYFSIAENHIRPRLGHVKTAGLTDSHIEDFMAELTCLKSPLSGSTARGISNVLRSVLVFAAKHGCPASPEACKCSKRPAKPEISVLTADEQRRLLTSLGVSPSGADLGIFICLKTGLRVGEICALKWGDVCFHSGVLSVNRTVQRIVSRPPTSTKTLLHFGEPKSITSKRKIPLSPALSELLLQKRGPSDCFIVSGRADKTIEPRSMQRHFKTVLRHAGIRDMNFHVLRHSFATKCVDSGFDVKSLSMILGHSSVSTTMNTYVHPSMEKIREMIARLD
ncbi:MAG: site-specific integrase [Clostridiales bacterium]|nr:site-specific integrase [Clostridiales bacterium]